MFSSNPVNSLPRLGHKIIGSFLHRFMMAIRQSPRTVQSGQHAERSAHRARIDEAMKMRMDVALKCHQSGFGV